MKKANGISRRDILKLSGLGLAGLAASGLVGKGTAAASGVRPQQDPLPATPLEQYPKPGQMRITFCGTWYTPRINQACNSVFVELGNENNDSFVFDCGSGVASRYIALGVPWSRMDKIFLTHLHGDHMSDLMTIYCFGPSGDRKTPLQIWGPSGDMKNEGTINFCKNLYEMAKWHRNSFSFLPTGYVNQRDGYDILPFELPYMLNPGRAYAKDGVTITHFPAIHARDGAISYRLDWNGHSMVFTGDTKPNKFVLQNAQGVDVLIHEMTTTPEVWTVKQSGLTPPNPIYYELLNINRQVIENSHTMQAAFGYILNQTKPRLGVATHFPNDPDLIQLSLDAIRCFNPDGEVAIAQDLLVVTIDADGTISQSLAQADQYAWNTGTNIDWDNLAPPKYPDPLAQFNRVLLNNIIPIEEYEQCLKG